MYRKALAEVRSKFRPPATIAEACDVIDRVANDLEDSPRGYCEPEDIEYNLLRLAEAVKTIRTINGC